MGYPPYLILPVLGSSVLWRGYYLRGIDSGTAMTLQTHQNGIPIDIRKFSLWRRKNLFAKMCDGKQQFFSEKSAYAAMRSVVYNCLAGDGPDLDVYICPFCGWWHFGHIPWDVEKITEANK